MTRRLLKELRILLYAAGAIAGTSFVLIAATPFAASVSIPFQQIAVASFFLGIPLLAAHSLGHEFQCRTLGLMSAQPISRTRLWFEKWSVMGLVVAAVALIQLSLFAYWRIGAFKPNFELWWSALFVAAVVCSAPLWTLLARSTIGGAAFSLAVMMLLEFSASLARGLLAGPDAPRELFAVSPWMLALRLAYCAVTLVAGSLLFARMQFRSASEGAASAPLASGSDRRWLHWPHSRPGAPLTNLFLKELRLHRPTLQISALFTLCWLVALAVFSVQSFRNPVAETTFTILLAVYMPLVLVLAGGLSVGEEHALGTHAWHLTLPVRARTQWAVKACVAVVVGGTFAVLLPLALRALAIRALGDQVGTFLGQIRPHHGVLIAGVLVLCFWSATLSRHTVRAAVMSGLIMVALVSPALRFGGGADVALSWLTRAMVRWQLPPDYFFKLVRPLRPEFMLIPALVVVFAGVALPFSFRAFRQMQVGARTIVGQVSVVLATLVVAEVLMASYVSAAGGLGWKSAPVRELVAGLQALSSGGTRVPEDPSPDDLARTGLLSEQTRRWLNGATIHVERVQPGQWSRPSRIMLFKATLRFPNGRTYVERYFDPPPESVLR